MRDYLAPLVGETEDGTEALLPEEQTILARRRRFSGEGWAEPAEGGPLSEGGVEAPRPEAGQGDPPTAGPGAGQENVLAALLAGAFFVIVIFHCITSILYSARVGGYTHGKHRTPDVMFCRM